MDWMCNLKRTLSYENKEYVLNTPNPRIETNIATPEKTVVNNKHIDDTTKVACIMIYTMAPNLKNSCEEYWPYEMNQALGEIFHKKARQECYEVVKALMAYKLKEGEFLWSHVQKMKRHMERLE